MRFLRRHGWEVWVYERYEDGFPQPLKNPSTPFKYKTVYLSGNKSLLNRFAIAVVGSRKASPEALEWAEKLGETLAETCPLVTGLAEGVDASAVKGVLKAGGCVVGVRPWLFPVSGEYFPDVVSRGCVISQQPPPAPRRPKMG